MIYIDKKFTVEDVRRINQAVMDRGKKPEAPVDRHVAAAMRKVHFSRAEINAAWAEALRKVSSGK